MLMSASLELMQYFVQKPVVRRCLILEKTIYMVMVYKVFFRGYLKILENKT